MGYYSRRKLLQRLLGGVYLTRAARRAGAAPAKSSVDSTALSQEEDAFLDELEKANYLFFWEQDHPDTCLIKDRCNARATDTGIVASIAGTGFGLTALCIAQQRGWVSLYDSRERALTVLRFLWNKMPTHRGFFFHWANVVTGERIWDAEASSIDTAILLCGVLTCREHFRHTEVYRLSRDIFNRVDWTWLSDDTSLLPHGSRPEIWF